MTPCIGQTNNDATQYMRNVCFTKRQTNTTYGPKHATLSGEWLGLRAEEGRGKPRYRLGEAHAAIEPRVPEWDLLDNAPFMGAGTPRTEAS